MIIKILTLPKDVSMKQEQLIEVANGIREWAKSEDKILILPEGATLTQLRTIKTKKRYYPSMHRI